MDFDSLPDESAAPPAQTLKFDDLPDEATPQQSSALQAALKPITSLPSTYQSMVNEATGQMGQGVGQIETGEPWNIAKGVGNVGLGALGYVTAPINAPLRTFVGQPVRQAAQELGAGQTGSELAGNLAEAGASFMLPVPKGLPREAAMPEEAPFGVTLSGGEKTDDLAMRQAEQQAIRGGDSHAQAWQAQRQAQLGSAADSLMQGLDPYGQTIAENPAEAGALASQAIRSEAARAKAGVQQAYATAREMPGQIHAGVFEGMPQAIKGDLTLGDNPVIIDDKLTPFASRMIDDLDNRIGQLKIQNKADPFGQPNPENIVGVDLNGVDQMRKRLSAFRKDAYASGNAADGRAAQAVLSSFDDRIDQAVNGGLFTGDKSAVAAWNNARAANTDYRSTFTAQKNDPVGRVVQKIIGDNVNDPLTPTKVIDQIVGSSGTSPSSLNIGVAKRIQSILGPDSPEWIGVKQGVLQRLIQPGEGEAGLGTAQQAQRLSKFLNSDIASSVYSPQEQATLRSYANLMRRITMPPGSYFPSAPPLQAAMATIRSRIGGIVGAIIGRQVVPIPLVGELAGLTAGSQVERALERLHTGVSKQLPLVGQQWQKWEQAQSTAQATGNPTVQRAAQVAAINLQRSLSPLGINLNEVAQSPGTANAQQQNIPGPPSQQQNGGRVEQQNGFSHGGPVQSKKTKTEVHYRAGTRKKECGICSMFQPPSSCTAVKGHIAATALCDLFEPKTKTKANIDSSHTVRSGANSSKDGKTVFIDHRIPDNFAKYLAIHEQVEGENMDKGYLKAHKIATAEERKAVEADGLKWDDYTHKIDGYLSTIEHEKNTNPPRIPLHVNINKAIGHHRSHNKVMKQ